MKVETETRIMAEGYTDIESDEDQSLESGMETCISWCYPRNLEYHNPTLVNVGSTRPGKRLTAKSRAL